ncbi:MAG: Rpn family recombination-promoting nuclease/putative transposase [Oribacterium sp.]|nr:Rpn family recombination-promoting nuclease/putative transposase [Oribacterium sp.]
MKNEKMNKGLLDSQLILDEKKRLNEQWKNIGISNDFVFCKVMQDKELLSELIRRILPDLKFTDLKIDGQKTIEIGPDIHGVRFDVFATMEDGRIVDIELQVLNTGNLPKRIRYYGSMADMQMLEKGVVYDELVESYVVMICLFDLYGEGRYMYTFTNRCKENPELEMGDGTTRIVLNATGTKDDISPKLKAFLSYVAGNAVEDEYVKKLDEAVQKARQNKKWRREYMVINMRDLEQQAMGAKRRDREKIAEMLQDGKTPEEIESFCKYPMKLIEEVQNSMMSVK